MYTLIDYLKHSWLARAIALTLVSIHWLPINAVPYIAIFVIMMIFWMVNGYQKSPSPPIELLALLENIGKDRGCMTTICLRLSPQPVFEFETKNYLFSDENWDIYYYGQKNQRYLEFGPKALSQRKSSIDIFETVLRLLPVSRLQRVMIATSADILDRNTSIHFLKPYFQNLAKRFRKVPYDILVGHFWNMPNNRTFYAYDFHQQVHASQYCQLLKQHIEESILQTFHNSNGLVASNIIAFDQLIHPLQSMIQAIQNHKQFSLQCALIFNKPIAWNKHLPKISRLQQYKIIWIYLSLSALIVLAVWQARDINSVNAVLKNKLYQLSNIKIESTKKPMENLSPQELLTQAVSYSRKHNLMDGQNIPTLPNERPWNPHTNLTQQDLISQLRATKPEILQNTIDTLTPIQTLSQMKQSDESINLEKMDNNFKIKSYLRCLTTTWINAPTKVSSTCVAEKQRIEESQWVSAYLDYIHDRLIPTHSSTEQSTQLTESILSNLTQNPQILGQNVTKQMPLLIHFAAKNKQEKQLTQLSNLTHFLSRIEQSRTLYVMKKFLASMKKQPFKESMPSAINKLDAEYSTHVENDMALMKQAHEWESINTSWQKEVLPVYSQLKTCFPFKADAQQDCPHGLVQKFFRQGGTIDNFINQHLKNHLGINQSGYYWKHNTPKTSPYLLEHLLFAKVLQSQLFNAQGNVEITAMIKPSNVPDKAQIRLHWGKHVYDINAMKNPEVKFRWQPYSGHIFSIASSGKPDVYDSPWGFYKWVMTHIHDEQQDAYNLSLMADKQQVLLKFYKSPGLNLWNPHLLSSFELPSHIHQIPKQPS